MTTEKYLLRLSWLTNTILSRLDKLEIDRSRLTNMVAPTDKEPVQTSPKDTMCEILSNVVDLDRETDGYVTEYKRIMAQVDTLTAPYAPAYLFRRYGRGQSVNEIASDMKISRSTAYRVHREALEEFEKMWGETYLRAKDSKELAVLEQSDTL